MSPTSYQTAPPRVVVSHIVGVRPLKTKGVWLSLIVGMPSERDDGKGMRMLNFDNQIPAPTDIPNIRQLDVFEAADQRAAQIRTAFLVVAANVGGIALLVLASN